MLAGFAVNHRPNFDAKNLQGAPENKSDTVGRITPDEATFPRTALDKEVKVSANGAWPLVMEALHMSITYLPKFS